MAFTSYEMVAANTASVNTGSYLNRTEYSLFVKGFVSDLWYGFSPNDVIEFGVWERDETFVNWDTLHQSKSYNTITLSYLNTLNFPVTYSYSELKQDFILNKNDKILVSPPTELTESLGVNSGSYFFTYNFTREMAGEVDEPLVIKEISPSRRELKLIPLSSSSPSYDAFCKKQVILQDVSPLYMSAAKYCPYEQLYNKASPDYMEEINIIKTIFFLSTDGAVINFLRNIYEDLIIYTTVPAAPDSVEVITGSLIRIQGIQTYFTNYLLSSANNIVDFSDIDNTFKGFVSASVERKFFPIGAHPLEPYVNAKVFVYDFFTKYYYQPIADVLSETYKTKYFSYFRNALNFGDNQLLPILQHGVMDERVNEQDPMTLLVKLKTELPQNFSIQDKCWVSNVSLSPYVLNAIVKAPRDGIVHKIGSPNFSLTIPNVSLTNTNKTYSAEDLANDVETDRELTINRNISELSVDYTNFQNFIVFSSAEVRLNIFKNKVINISTYSSSIDNLNQQNQSFIAESGSTYPFYTEEFDKLQTQITEIVNSFDGYESYLYRSGDYLFTSGAFVSSSFIAEMDHSASYYDKNNLDSLINNCPAHIITNSDNDDYVIFLSMIGHFFDQIYEYISNIPSERQLGHSSTEVFTRRVVDYMLETFGWKLDDSLEQAGLLNNYLTSEQQDGLNAMSAEERLKEVRNRVLINLPQIYKTKGTEEAVRLILACYGIPSTLLTVREYGGVNYTDDTAAYTTYERAFMYSHETSSVPMGLYSNGYYYSDVFYNQLPTDTKTYLFKIAMDDASIYPYNKDITLMGNVDSSVAPETVSGSGNWAVGFERKKRKDTGRMWFRIGYNAQPHLKIYTDEFPLFDGNIYNVMIRRNLPSDAFSFTTNVDAVPCTFDLWVQRNEFGQRILRHTASVMSHEYDTNHQFSTGASGSYLVRGGWFIAHNGQKFVGLFDKLQVWFDPITDSNFEDYVNSINSYSFSGSRQAHQSLVFREHTDYPFDMANVPPGTSIPIIGVSNELWDGQWRNANPFYAIDSSQKQIKYLDVDMSGNSDFTAILAPGSGSQKLVYNTSSGCWVSQSCYPFQFRIVDYPSTWGVSKYGPNTFRNEKIKHISQSVEARFDDKNRSTHVNPNSVAPDSNQIGFFADPQDFKNKDIVRYFGNFDFMNAIGDPSNQYSSSYDALRVFRKQYATSLNEYSGSHTLFNELITLYKLYFNRSIFEAIRNVVPARSNTLTGILIEPTILERPRYAIKPIMSETNTGSVFYADITASHYFQDPNTKLLRLSMSLEDSMSMDLDVSYLNLPIRNHPVNYGGNYIGDFMDLYQFGTFAGGVQAGEPEPPFIFIPVIASFTLLPDSGLVPLTVTFTNTSINAIDYFWDFGDGNTSIEFNPVHTYTTDGTFTVALTASRGEQTSSVMGSVEAIVPSVPCEPALLQSGVGGFPDITTLVLGTGLGTVRLSHHAISVPDKFVVEINGVVVLDTGYRGAASQQSALNTALANRGLPPETIQGPGSSSITFTKSTTYQYAVVKVYAPIVTSQWSFILSCPV